MQKFTFSTPRRILWSGRHTGLRISQWKWSMQIDAPNELTLTATSRDSGHRLGNVEESGSIVPEHSAIGEPDNKRIWSLRHYLLCILSMSGRGLRFFGIKFTSTPFRCLRDPHGRPNMSLCYEDLACVLQGYAPEIDGNEWAAVTCTLSKRWLKHIPFLDCRFVFLCSSSCLTVSRIPQSR